MTNLLTVAPSVAAALHNNQPVVALESTLITHGLPYPANYEIATAMEAAVRDAGATPATIAILEGQITVGLSDAQTQALAQTKNARKCSRRDFPIALGLDETAATTVAGTMIVAQMAGIRVFATGGIGGVHRGHPFDVSADLLELGRTPVAVVCAGPKSILDLSLTLEVLETQGVPVIGYGTETLPSFFSRDSGLPIDTCIDTPEQAAQIIHAADSLNAQHGLLFAVPVPEESALPFDVAEAAIQQATDEAEANGIHGKDVTPYVLQRVNEITEGRSLAANKALLLNNARVAAQIAIQLTR